MPTLDTVTVTAGKLDNSSPGASTVDVRGIASRRAATSDSARLLEDTPGVSLYGAGGISSLPVVHGLADDRLRIQVDGMDLASACPNHMNSTLSYINPNTVAGATVFAGITPVSVGGDSIGGTIQMKSAPPRFAEAGQDILAKGEAGTYYRSNGSAHGYNVGATLASQNTSLSFSKTQSQSNNYHAAQDFKAPGIGSLLTGGRWLSGSEVGSSAYTDSETWDAGIALRLEGHLLQLNVSEQSVDFEGFPNQRMDMTANTNKTANLRYTGQYRWGVLEMRAFTQDTSHLMDMGPDRFFYGTGMPMKTEADTRGAVIKGDIELSENDILRVGGEYLTYDLDDWWPPVGAAGMMCCNAFWNVKNGSRDRVGVFGEWESGWNDQWLTLFGIRSDTVKSDAGKVQGYSNMGIWKTDAQTFNALDHQRTDHHLDLAALARYTPDAMQTYEFGYARKTRSPNLYERYPWSTNSMAALMNNFVGDGNGYVGNPDLRPETAHTFSATADWHDADNVAWGLKTTAYRTDVRDYIDAQRCRAAQCGGASNLTQNTGFVSLQYDNQSAMLHGMDISGRRLLGRSGDYGNFTAKGMMSYVKGENRTTRDNLYHIMPLNAKLALEHGLGSWTTTAELQLVAAKTHVSQVRNEVPTAGYSLFNLRGSYEWKHARFDIGVENVFNRFYSMPLGGAYVGQGASMTKNGIPWGISVPGMGRSINAAFALRF